MLKTTLDPGVWIFIRKAEIDPTKTLLAFF
jgi:hypothetical protein